MDKQKQCGIPDTPEGFPRPAFLLRITEQNIRGNHFQALGNWHLDIHSKIGQDTLADKDL